MYNFRPGSGRRPQAGRLVLGAFSGLNTAKDPQALALDEAAACLNVDVSNGTLRGLYGPGTTVATVGGSKKHVHYEDGLSWYSNADPQFHCYDATYPFTGRRYSFYTRASGGSGTAGYANGSVSDKWLGIGAPGSAPTAGTGSASARWYRYTYITNRASTSNAPMESNPSSTARLTTTTVNVTASADAAVDGIRMYASDGDVNGPYYLTDTFTNTTTAVTPSATNVTATPLSWEIGGRNTNATYIDDHQPAPSPNTISSALHTAFDVSGNDLLPCSGILFAGIGSQLQWSQAGYPWYWPYYNFKRFDSYIECIVTDQATTYILTDTNVYSVTGTNDEGMNFQRSRATMGTTWGHSAVMTPYGLVFQAEGGIALFDGNTAHIITADVLAPSDLTKNYAAVWWDNQLLLVSQSDSSGGYVLDFSKFPDVRITTHNIAARAITRADAYTTPGPFVATWADGYVGPWRPRQRGNVGGASPLPWSWKTGKVGSAQIAGASPGRPFYAPRIWVDGTGDVSISVRAGRGDDTTIGTQVVTGDSWLPGSWGEVDWLELTISSAGGAGVLRGLEIEYEVAR